jgi:hypothetical protein
LKKILILIALAIGSVVAQPKDAAYAPESVKVLGTLDYGQTSRPVVYSKAPGYRAFVFTGDGNDQIEVTLTGAGRNTPVAVADSSLKVIGRGTGRLSLTLPYRGPDTEAYYIVFKDVNQPSRLVVRLRKTGPARPADATR